MSRLHDLDGKQLAAATSERAEVAVSAGAGSGKTRLLVARYLHFLWRDRLPLSAVAAITFTNKAAGAMKLRVAETARRNAIEDPGDAPFWRQVAENIHRAPISTIHAFCSSLLRAHPVEAGLDPVFTVIDEVMDEDLRRTEAAGFVRERLDTAPGDYAFLLDVFGMRRLLSLYHVLLGNRTRVLTFADRAEHAVRPDPGYLEQGYLDHMRNEASRRLETLERFHAFRPEGDRLTVQYDLLMDLFRELGDRLATGDVEPERLSALCGGLNLRQGSAKEWGADTIGEVKAAMKECRGFLEAVARFHERERGITGRAAALLMREYALLDARYLARKKAMSAIDNDDLLIETRKLLRSHVRIRLDVSNSFSHIMVDEFQDTDDIQMDIINMIAGNSSAALFVVGDPKQSIYRFRGADITVFNKFIRRAEVEFHVLPMNYRSTPAILSFVNDVFGPVIGEEPVTRYDTVYTPMWPPPNIKDGGVTPAVDILAVEGRSDDVRRTAARAVAERIRELHDGPPHFGYGEMVVLMRSGTSAGIYAAAFLRAGIPFVNRIGGRLTDNPVAYDIGNLLGWLHRPDDPLKLTAVLTSPFFDVAPDDLALLHARAGIAARMSAAMLGAAEPEALPAGIRHARDTLAALLDLRDRVPVRELLERAFDLTGYTLALLADTVEGELSLAVTDLILETAGRFEANGGAAAEFAELLAGGGRFTTETAGVQPDGDAVSLMTIHGAKGLEFGAVFLVEPGRGRSGGGDIRFDDALGPAFKIRDDRGTFVETYVHAAAVADEHVQAVAESKRLFYVACTRAERYLMIAGAATDKEDPAFESDDWMTWLNAVLGLDGSGGEVVTSRFRYRRIPPVTDREDHPSAVHWRTLRAMADVPGDPAAFPADLLAVPSPPPPGEPPEHLSPSGIVAYNRCPARYRMQYLLEIDSTPSGGSGGGAAYGTYAHRVMERLDLTSPDGWGSCADIFASPGAPSLWRERLRASLTAFASSGLYREIATSQEVRREEPFAMIERDVLVRGTIDLRYRARDGIVIVDYKSGRFEGSGASGEGGYTLQLGIYALAVSRAGGEDPVRAGIYHLGEGRWEAHPVDRALLDTATRVIGEAAAGIAAGAFAPRDGAQCAECPYAALCAG